MLGGPLERSGFPPPSGGFTPSRCGLFLLRRSHTEVIHEARIIPLDGRPHLPSHLHQWLGDSRGRWEGDTLVVETTNYTDKTGSFNTLTAAWGSGEDLHLIERLRRVDADTLVYEFTIDDPKTFTRSFTASIPMKATEGPIYEYACHEGNYAMPGMLAGALAAEKEAAESR